MNKFGAKKTNGYDSKGEANRAYELGLMQRAGRIQNLREQVKFELIPSQDGERPVHYTADFAYEQDGQTVVEDFKGMKTPEYVIKRKLMLFRHGIRVKEVS